MLQMHCDGCSEKIRGDVFIEVDLCSGAPDPYHNLVGRPVNELRRHYCMDCWCLICRAMDELRMQSNGLGTPKVNSNPDA